MQYFEPFRAPLSEAELARRQPRALVLSGDESEVALVDGIVRQAGRPARVYGLAGEVTLGELGALLEGADLLMANNTGPVHVAAALGTPVVDLYALTNPQHTPWRVPARVLHRDVPCGNCYKSVCPNGTQACLVGVAPHEAVEAALALLSARRSMRALEHRITPQES